MPILRNRKGAHRRLHGHGTENRIEVRRAPRGAAFGEHLLDAIVHVARDLTINPAKLARGELIGVALGEPFGLEPENVQRPGVLEEAETEAEPCEENRYEDDESEGHGVLVLVVGVTQEAERRADEVRGSRNCVTGADVPRLADETRVHDAEIVVQRANVAEAFVLVGWIAFEALQVGGDRIELRGVETFGRAGRHPGPVGVETDRGAGTLRQLARERVVEDADADDGPRGRLRHVVLDRTDDDAVDAPAEDPRVVANPAVERVGDDRVASELEIVDAARLVEPHLSDDASGLIHREHRVELLVGRDRVVVLAERHSDLVLRFGGDLLRRCAGLRQVRPYVLIERGNDERDGTPARIVAKVRRHDLAVAGERLTHRAHARAIEHGRREEQDE